MRLWQWVWLWLWLVGLGAIETAPSLENAKASALGAQSPLFIDRPDFFDYSDSDQAKILALAQFIGEKPISFANAGSNSRLFHHILVGALIVAAFFLLFQFCTHMSCQKGS
uniref:Uncharacterized protein n=2 Tax=Rousettus aegyptiacus TaxID=9407 RepID=A0A7J8EWL9_ROUAE|nr:hypothetical protein HJG63_001717 [Rousettus aegyptiacus]